MNVISSCNYDGTRRNIVLYSTETLRHPFSITTFEDFVYWTDWDKEAVFRANKFTGKDVEPVTAMHMVSLKSLDNFLVLFNLNNFDNVNSFNIQ